MSICTFLASDYPLTEYSPKMQYPIEIDVDSGTVWDGGKDDNYYLRHFDDAVSYSNKRYGVCLEWNYTDGRANQIIEYIKNALQKSDSIELWHIWLTDYHEYEDRPFVHRKTCSVAELTAQHIKEIDDAEIWNTPDKVYPERPSFYCLTITR